MNVLKTFSKISLILYLISILGACERISFKEYALPEYDGDLEWEQITNKAEWPKRYDHDAIVFKEKLWIIGGYNPGMTNEDTYLEDVWSSEDGIAWVQENTSAPFLGRRGHALAVVGDNGDEKMLLIGGFSVDEETGYRQYNNDVWETADGSNWTQIKTTSFDDSTTWTPRMHHKIVKANHNNNTYLYLIGGQTMLNDHNAAYSMIYHNDIWRSTDGISWEAMQNSDYGIRSEHAVAVSPEGKIYIQGGMHGNSFETEDNSSHPSPDWHHLWSSSDGENWTPAINTEDVPESYFWRSAHEMIFYKDHLWVFPGKTTSEVHYHFTSSGHYPIWTFSETNSWKVDSEGTAIDARHSYSLVVFKDKIWVLGGFTNRSGQANDIWNAKL